MKFSFPGFDKKMDIEKSWHFNLKKMLMTAASLNSTGLYR